MNINKIILTSIISLSLTACAGTHKQRMHKVKETSEFETVVADHKTSIYVKLTGFYCPSGKTKSYSQTEHTVYFTCHDGSKYNIQIKAFGS